MQAIFISYIDCYYRTLPVKLVLILFVSSLTGPRYIPLLLGSGVMESVQEIRNTPFNGVSELAQMLINTVTDFQSSRKWIMSIAVKHALIMFCHKLRGYQEIVYFSVNVKMG